ENSSCGRVASSSLSVWQAPTRENEREMDEQRYRVHGTITDEDGRELSHAAVTVWEQLLRVRRTLAEGRADEDGRYRLAYEPPEHIPGNPLIVVGAPPRKTRLA